MPVRSVSSGLFMNVHTDRANGARRVAGVQQRLADEQEPARLHRVGDELDRAARGRGREERDPQVDGRVDDRVRGRTGDHVDERGQHAEAHAFGAGREELRLHLGACQREVALGPERRCRAR